MVAKKTVTMKRHETAFKAHEISSVFAIQDLPKSFELNLVKLKSFFLKKKNQNFHYSESFINPHLLSFFNRQSWFNLLV